MEINYDKEKHLWFSIDNLTILGNLKYRDFYRLFIRIGGEDYQNDSIRNERAIFEYSFKNEDVGYIQVDPTTLKVRIEFNPNKISLKGRHILSRMLDLLDEDTIHFTRIDLAIDLFNYNISDYNIIDIGNRKKAYFYSRTNKLETMYSGSNKSSKYIRIYNKAIEQKLDDLDWWRFEIQLRDVYIDKYLNELVKFYDDIMVFRYSSVSSYDFETNAVLEYLLHDINRINELSKNAKTKYKKIIRNLQMESIDFFDDVISVSTEKVRSYLSYICTERKLKDRL